jgi:hypothetical protein
MSELPPGGEFFPVSPDLERLAQHMEETHGVIDQIAHSAPWGISDHRSTERIVTEFVDDDRAYNRWELSYALTVSETGNMGRVLALTRTRGVDTEVYHWGHPYAVMYFPSDQDQQPTDSDPLYVERMAAALDEFRDGLENPLRKYHMFGDVSLPHPETVSEILDVASAIDYHASELGYQYNPSQTLQMHFVDERGIRHNWSVMFQQVEYKGQQVVLPRVEWQDNEFYRAFELCLYHQDVDIKHYVTPDDTGTDGDEMMMGQMLNFLEAFQARLRAEPYSLTILEE